MADEEQKEEGNEESPKKSGGLVGKLIVWSIVFVLGIGTGAAVPIFLMPTSDAAEDSLPGFENIKQMEIPEPGDKMAFVDFEEVVVNLNDSRYSRFVSCTFSVQVAETQQEAIQELVTENEAVLTNWLIAHLREKKLEDVRGKLGHNTLRREIRDTFNELLFTDGIERIQDVYFKDFKIQ